MEDLGGPWIPILNLFVVAYTPIQMFLGALSNIRCASPKSLCSEKSAIARASPAYQ